MESECEWVVLSYKTDSKALQDKFTKIKNFQNNNYLIIFPFLFKTADSRCSFPLPNVKAFQVIPCQWILYLTWSHNISIKAVNNIPKWQRWESEIWKYRKITTATVRYGLKERIKVSTGKASVAGVSATSFGLCVTVWGIYPSSLVKLPDLKERIRHSLKWELGRAGEDQAEGSGGSCAWDRQRQRQRCLWLWLGKARALLCFTWGFCLNWCAWINKQFPEERTWMRLICLWDFNSPKMENRNLSSALAPIRPMKPRESCCIRRNQVTTTFQNQPKESLKTARYLKSTIPSDLKKIWNASEKNTKAFHLTTSDLSFPSTGHNWPVS